MCILGRLVCLQCEATGREQILLKEELAKRLCSGLRERRGCTVVRVGVVDVIMVPFRCLCPNH